MGNGDLRFSRIQTVLNVIKKCNEINGKGANIDKLCYELSDFFRVRPEKVKEYVKELLKSEKIVQQGVDHTLWINTEDVKREYQEVLGL